MSIPHFNRLTIREVRSETRDAITVAFDIPTDLRPAYRFRAGQFLTLLEAFDGEELRRSYSICSSEPDYARTGELRVAIKRVAGGRFSNWAHEHLSAGGSIDVMTPDGRFCTEPDPSRIRHVVGFASGSGITPILSLIATILETEAHARFSLVYGNRGVASILFLEALEAMKNRWMERLRLIHVLSGEPQAIELFSGRLDASRCNDLLASVLADAPIDEAFVCGPAPMMDAAHAALLNAGVAAQHIHVERFGAPAVGVAQSPAPSVADDAPCAQVTVIVDGQHKPLRVPLDGLSILDAGLASGASLPYACKAGVCCTCRARVLEGEVRMDRNFTLEPQEIAQGFVLTCHAHPVSERVVVSFDER